MKYMILAFTDFLFHKCTVYNFKGLLILIHACFMHISMFLDPGL